MLSPLQKALRKQLADASYRGTFESHVTTQVSDLPERDRFRELCRQLGVRCVLIELPEGVTRSQPMTAHHHHGDLAGVISEVEAICRGLSAAGFPLARVKLEAVAGNEGVPDSDAEAAALPASNYFEFHVKLLLPADARLDVLQSCCARHSARLSRNALKVDRHGVSERFVTLRVYAAGRSKAFACLEALEHDLAAAGFAIASRQREYTIFDSAEQLDAGWLDRPSSQGDGA